MQKKHNILLIQIICGTILLAGCVSPSSKVIIPVNFQDTANPIAKNLINGLDKQDYAVFTRDFDEKMLKALPSTAMTKLHKLLWNQNGNFQSLAIKQMVEEKGYVIAFFNLVF